MLPNLELNGTYARLLKWQKRGFYSFDRDVRTPFEDSKYRLVASPGKMRKELEYNLPAVDMEMVPEELDGKELVRLIDERTNNRNIDR